MSISSLIDQYLDFLVEEKKVSHYTIKDYSYYLNHFLEFLKSNNTSLLSDPEEINKYRTHLKDFKKSTRNYFLIALRSFFQYLETEGVKTVGPEKIILENHPGEVTEVIDQASIEKILSRTNSSTLEGLRDRSIIWLLFSGGLKVSELTRLNCASLNWDKAELQIDSSRKMKLPPELLEVLQKYMSLRKDNFKPLFIRLKGTLEPENSGEKMRLSPRSVERALEKYTKTVNLETKATPQVLRHSFAANLLADGEKLELVQKKLGHKNLHSSKRYQKIVQNFAKKSAPAGK